MLWKPDVSLTPRGCQMTSEEWLDEVFHDEGIQRLAQEFDCTQDAVDLDYNGGVPPYEENK